MLDHRNPRPANMLHTTDRDLNTSAMQSDAYSSCPSPLYLESQIVVSVKNVNEGPRAGFRPVHGNLESRFRGVAAVDVFMAYGP